MTVATNHHAGHVLGILGGMGPLASAEFVRTIYSYHRGAEQGAPVVMLYSDPTFPDRTESLLRRSDELLLERLAASLTHLCELGATQVVICCVTSHYLLPRLPPSLRSRVTSLIDTVFAGLLRTEKRHLLMCTQGTRQSRLFESHPQWEAARDRVVLAQASDQQQIHELIYRLKRNDEIAGLLPLAEALLAKYQVDSFIVGCTELHLVTRHLVQAGGRAQYGYIDPLTMIAEGLAQRIAHTAT